MIPMEIERKFLVESLPARFGLGTKIVQGYLTEKGPAIRVRISTVGYQDENATSEAFLTIKGKRKEGELGKPEFEYKIPVDDAQFMLDNLCGDRIIEKTRYMIMFCNYVYELDIFGGKLKGLVVAELEYPDSAAALMVDHPKPDWLGRDVTDDKQYTNKKLARSQKVPTNYIPPTNLKVAK